MPKTIRRAKRCQHVHVSGRRCAMKINPDRTYCGLHRAGMNCIECNAMLEAFRPPKGWPKGTGDLL